MTEIIFGPSGSRSRATWNASDFTDVDDRLRGGSSRSKMQQVADSSDDGTVDFTGFLDTTTLGGAGFASQAYSRPLPGEPLDGKEYKGLCLVVRPLPATENQSLSSSMSASMGHPGGGKGPVRSYVLNLKTQEAKHRPDGRRESQIVYEFTLEVKAPAADDACETSEHCCDWADFAPTYRGKPADDAPPLDPQQIKEWSIMARSDFGAQSGPFALRLITLGAIHRDGTSGNEKRSLSRDEATLAPPTYTSITQPPLADTQGTSGEYYGFALYIFATVAMVLWIVWALTPDAVLRKLGIEWYPNREWAFLLPAWSLFAVLFTYTAFMMLNVHNNPPHDDLSQVVDSHSNILPLGYAATAHDRDGSVNIEKHPLYHHSMASTGAIDGPMADDIYDLPPGMISRERHGL